jgi:hypothetical protein
MTSGSTVEWAPRFEDAIRKVQAYYHAPDGEVHKAARKLVSLIVSRVEEAKPTAWEEPTNPAIMRMFMKIKQGDWCPAEMDEAGRKMAYGLAIELLFSIPLVKHLSMSGSESDPMDVTIYVPDVKFDGYPRAAYFRSVSFHLGSREEQVEGEHADRLAPMDTDRHCYKCGNDGCQTYPKCGSGGVPSGKKCACFWASVKK